MKKPENSRNKKSNGAGEIIRLYPATAALCGVCLLMSVAMFFFDYRIALAELCVLAVTVAAALLKKNHELSELKSRMLLLQKKLSPEETGELRSFPLPTVLFDNTERIVWCSNQFKNSFMSDKSVKNTDIKQFTSGRGLDYIREHSRFECEYMGKHYTAFCTMLEYKKETYYALYYIENTELKKYKIKYENSRPVIMLIAIDTAEEYLRDFRESQQAEILGGVESIIENWFNNFGCIARKLSSGRFLVFAEKSALDKMKEDKFSLLSSVRSYTYAEKPLGITLSVGVGTGEDLVECEKYARQALDMSLGRGGDQVAVKNQNNEYEFFGGVVKGVAKRTKVRTRIVASAIAETIKYSSNVLIMGHRFADLDALGAAVGVSLICKALGKKVKIVMSSQTSLAKPLASYLEEKGYQELFCEPAEAEKHLTERTLLVIVDTHRKSFLEYPELFDAVRSAVVIDHHRKTVDHINKAMVFYHEPNASSASEMVTELIEYMNFDIDVPSVCAEALLSGIALDTKNFVMNTGVRTFEAAAFLRGRGADTVAVKQLFANSMKTQKDKSEVVKNAAMYKNCAVGVVDFESDDIRIVSSQAADELLNVANVAASFVVFRTGNTINISARSYGELNVQLVMELLGGGGHQTMAAAQLEGETFENALNMLKNAIDKINEGNIK